MSPQFFWSCIITNGQGRKNIAATSSPKDRLDGQVLRLFAKTSSLNIQKSQALEAQSLGRSRSFLKQKKKIKTRIHTKQKRKYPKGPVIEPVSRSPIK
jgi:hypothetical protein